MALVLFDYETKSGYSLPDCGRHKYFSHPDADLICMSYRVGLDSKTRLWLPGNAPPFEFLEPSEHYFMAFNIQFDALAASTVGRTKNGFCEIPYANQIDLMAVASRLGLPRSLDKLGAACDVALPKLSTGKALKQIFCVPPYHNPKLSHHDNMVLKRSFYDYGIRDTDCMAEIVKALPIDRLPPNEQAIWTGNCRMNRRGVPINTIGAKAVKQVVFKYLEKRTAELPLITDGAVDTIGQTKKMRQWAEDQGVYLPDFTALTVSQTIDQLEEEGVPHGTPKGQVLEMLKLRQDIGGAAVKKYKRLVPMIYKDRIHDNSFYHGAGTGRTTGGGFQLLNLPRAKLDKIEGMSFDDVIDQTVQSFIDKSVLMEPGSVLFKAKALIRNQIRTTPEKILMVVDWSSIEYVLLMGYCGETEKVKQFADGRDPYILFGTKLFDKPYEDITKEERQRSKPPVLGSGYMLGARGLVEYADGYGVKMTLPEAKYATNLYRKENPLVVKRWYALKEAAHKAVANPGQKYTVGGTTFYHIKKGKFTWLIMTIPSGRSIFYCQPSLVAGTYGPVITHLGVNPKNKQWGTVYLKPQRIIENVIQAMSRDILETSLARLREEGFTPIMTVYDEIVCEEPRKGMDERFKQMQGIMCEPPTWAPVLPLKVDGYMAKSYRKD